MKTKLIDLDSIFEILQRGVMRSGVFTGIGLNASEQNYPLSLDLTTEGPYFIEFIKAGLDDKARANILLEFGKWIRANGLRELIETLSIYMDKLYFALFGILERRDQLDELSKFSPKKFAQKGIGEKIEHLAKVIPISEQDVKIVRSWNRARNCYAHRRGLISDQDVDRHDGTYKLIWMGPQFEVAEPDGTIVIENDIYDKTFENGGDFQIRRLMKEKQLIIGEELLIANRRDLAEIYVCAFEIGKRLHHATINFARENDAFREKIVTSKIAPESLIKP